MKKIISIILCLIFVFSAVSVGAYAASVDDPANWTTRQIIDYYKQAADKTDGESREGLEYKGEERREDLQFWSDELESAFWPDMTPFRTNVEGVTGDYKKLSVSDIVSASAEKSGDYIIINLKTNDQNYTHGNYSRDGSVNRLAFIRAIGEGVLSFYNFETKCRKGMAKYEYTDAYAKNIKINTATGKIENGEWGYDVKVEIKEAWIYGNSYSNDVIRFKVVVEYPKAPTIINDIDFPEEISVRYKSNEPLNIAPVVHSTGNHYTVNYSCSNYEVASISYFGDITTFRRGNCVVTCKVKGEDGNTIQKDCKVNVYYSRGQWFIMIFLLGWLWY